MKANKNLQKKYFSRMADFHKGEFNLAMVYANASKKDGDFVMHRDFLKLANEHLDAQINYLNKLAAL